jgi:Asp-tRNA(Asn)/Glu-tRNA(Gln) amidotransferase A subunit family amidase
MLSSEYIQARQTAYRVYHELKYSFEKLSLDAVISLHGLAAFIVAGCPALTLPVGIDQSEGLPVPIVLNGLRFTEGKLFGIGAALEAALGKGFQPSLI